jgi:signal transduction histidine kinase
MAGLAFLGWRLRGSYLDLNKANRQLARANETLEMKVQERTKDLSKAYAALKSSQSQVVQSEKMASLGQMVAGVAHEINTPLGFVRSNVELIGDMFKDVKRLMEQYANAFGLIRSPEAADDQVAQAINQLTVSEAETDPHVLLEEADTLISEGMRGLNQINDLVMNLKDFSRLDRSRSDRFDVNAGLDSTLSICRNQLKNTIEIVKDYGELPPIEGAPSQINQVFLNIINNASQAIEGAGQIRLTTRGSADKVQVRIEDTGCGMTPEVMSKIFEPFFTTKDVGKGTGLGLSISYQIIKEHGGNIDVKSQPGKGSAFTITLPVHQAQQKTEAAPAVAAAY